MKMHRLQHDVQVEWYENLDVHVPTDICRILHVTNPSIYSSTKIVIITYNLVTMSRGMGPTKAKLIGILLISALLALENAIVSSTVEDLMVVQCKYHCKHDLQNQKECEDKCNEKMMMKMEKETRLRQKEEKDPFCEAFCKHFLEDGEEINQSCITVCPRNKSIPKMMSIERRQKVGGESVANGALQTKCNRKCSSYTEPEALKKCMSQCFRSIVSKTLDNEAVCETSCTVIREKPLSIECIRVCHEIIPGVGDAST